MNLEDGKLYFCMLSKSNVLAKQTEEGIKIVRYNEVTGIFETMFPLEGQIMPLKTFEYFLQDIQDDDFEKGFNEMMN